MKVWLSGLFFFTVFFFEVNAQEVQQEPNILPPSPTAAELGKYGFVPVGLATGTAQVGVPLYTFKTRNLEVPISLSYQSNGTKVDQNASWVGLNWSLDAGGVVTRIVRDDPDENNLMYVNDYVPFPENFNWDNPIALDYLKNAAEESNFDTEPDIFAFNFLGYSGKFVFDREGHAVIMPYQNLVIERFWNPETYTLGSFVFTTPDGVRYTFGAVETSKTFQAACAKNYDLPVETAWYLTKIEHPTGDTITLHYQSTQYSYYAGVSQFVSVSMQISNCPGTEDQLENTTEDSCPTRILSSVVSLQRIESNDYGSVEFNAVRDRSDLPDYKLETVAVKNRQGQTMRTFSFGYTFSSSSQQYGNEHTVQQELQHRMFLTSLTEYSGTQQKVHSFGYHDINGLPPRLSYAQDHWGYFNGKDNNDFVPKSDREKPSGQPLFGTYGGNRSPDGEFAKKGMLDKITYPTGGYTQFFYEPNTSYGSKIVYGSEFFDLDKTVPDLDGEEVPPMDVTVSEGLDIVVRQDISFTLSAEKDGEIDTGHDKARITIYDLTTNTQTLVSEAEANGFTNGEVILQANHRYRFTLYVSGYGVHGTFGFYYLRDPQEVWENMETGGVRIAKIVNHDYVTGGDEITNYLYAKADNLSQSTGRIGFPPDYYTGNSVRTPCGVMCDYSETSTATLHSSSMNTLFSALSNNIYYRYVTVSKGSNFANGAEEHEFILNFDEPGQQVWGTRNIKNAPLTNFGWNNGLEKYFKFYKKTASAFNLIKQVYSEYVEDPANYKEVPALVVRKNYDLICYALDATVACDESNVNLIYQRYTCTKVHSHHWAILPGGTICVDGEMNWITIGAHPCNGKLPGTTAPIPSRLDHLDAIKYVNISRWFYLKKKIETTFDDQGSIETMVEYDYDNPIHAQLTRETVTQSDGKQKVTVTKYPDDYNAIENMQVLKDKHIVGLPVKKETTVAGNQIAGSVTRYNNNGQPLEVYTYESTAAVPLPAHNPAQFIPANYHPKLSLSYDGSGNVKQVTTTRTPVKSYLWGYNNTLPIAEIVNASIEAVSTNFTVFHTSFEGDTELTSIEAKTGNSGHVGSYTVKAPKVNGNYLITYWEKENEGSWIPKKIPLAITTGNENDVVIGSSTSVIDEVRVYPADALMTTYTYDPMVGVTSITDPNNLTTYYKYDPLGRLETVKDSDGNLVKHYKYHYYNQTEE